MGGTHPISSRMWDERRTSCYLGESRGWPMVGALRISPLLSMLSNFGFRNESLYIYWFSKSSELFITVLFLLPAAVDAFGSVSSKDYWCCCMGYPLPWDFLLLADTTQKDRGRWFNFPILFVVVSQNCNQDCYCHVAAWRWRSRSAARSFSFWLWLWVW